MSNAYVSIKPETLLKSEIIFYILITQYIITNLFKAASKSGSSL